MWICRVLAVLSLVGFAGLATGCNTIDGVGKDISAAARGVGKALEGE